MLIVPPLEETIEMNNFTGDSSNAAVKLSSVKRFETRTVLPRLKSNSFPSTSF